MSKDLQTLIRLNEWTVDERRRELGDVLGSLESLESGLARLREELAREQHAAQSSPGEAGFLYGGYAVAVIGRRDRLNAGIVQMEAKVTEARERLDEAYRELKKYEVAQENRTCPSSYKLEQVAA
ncbi:MAG: hypothetical protein HQ494_11520 [Rhodospirillales bacterium]|nr:hypothetical protein [Rhodospirillales bacterium]